MWRKIKNNAKLFKTAFKGWWAKDPFSGSAVIAYFAIFAIPGLLLIIMTIVGYFFGDEVVNTRLASQISSTMGADAAQQVQDMVKLASESKNSVWATIIGVIILIVGATGVFAEFQKSLNMIWEVKADKSKSGVWRLIRVRLFSLGLIVAVAFIMMVSLIISTLLSAMGDWLSNHFSESLLVIVQILNFIISFSIITGLFALMFKIFPDAKIKWSHIWLGSIVTTLLFLLGMYGLSLYFSHASPGSGYGAAGSIIIILLWVSYTSMIVFYGAEFTHAYAVRQEGSIPPDKNAVKRHGHKT